MILINPNYLFNHVIFINPDKRFIFIETEVYRKIHSIIFKGRHSTPKQRAKLRSLFYDTYYNMYFKGANISHSDFNKKILDIYRNDSVISFDHTTQTEGPGGNIILADSMPYYVEEDYDVGEEKIFDDDSSIRKSLVKMKEVNSDVIQTMVDSMNYKVIQSHDYQLLVDFLGYGKIVNIFKRFCFSKEYKIFDEYEYHFIFNSLSFLAQYRLNYFERNFGFICGDCYNIDKHRVDYHKLNKNAHSIDTLCSKSYWYSKKGIIKEQIHSDSLSSEYSNEMFDKHGKLNVISNRLYLQIGLFHADLSTTLSYENIVIANNNKFMRAKLDGEIDHRMNNHLKLSRGILPFMIHISDLIEIQNGIKVKLEQYDSLDYKSYCDQYFDNYIEIEKRVDSIQDNSPFGTSSSSSLNLDNLLSGRRKNFF